MLLGDMGADVIKVEKPQGDENRLMKPAIDDLSTYFMVSNRNKRSLTLNLKDPRGKKILLGILENADVVVENFRPGVMERLGFGFEALRKINPKIVMTSISGFGQDGPHAQRPAFDSIAQAIGGLMGITGEDKPVLSGTWVGDYSAGLYAAFGTVLALLHREHTGMGQHLDIALLDSIISWLRTAVPDFLLFGKKHVRNGGRDAYHCPIGTFQTSDGYIFITAATQEQYAGVARAAGHPEWIDDPRFATELARLANSSEVNRLVAGWTTSLTAEEALSALMSADVPCAPINDIEQVLANPQVQHRENVIWTKCHTGQDIPLPGIPLKFSDTPGSVRMPPPKIGDYNEEFYMGSLGLSREEMEKLGKEGVI
jgi:crotonobetainyl-CoA:carnitine CoA-transferase CaiB-like acyl-CoA transferase